MDIFEISPAGKQEFNRFVIGQETGSFLQSWEWGEWQQRLGREVVRFGARDGKGEMALAAQFVRHALPWDKDYFYAPYGPVAGPGFEPRQLELLAAAVRQKFPKTMFVRFEPKAEWGRDLAALGMAKVRNTQPGTSLLLDLGQDEARLLAGMHPKTRYNIRLAQKHGVAVEKDLAITPGHGLYYREAVELIVNTAVRQGYAGHPRKYYEDMVDFFAQATAGSGIRLSVYKALYRSQLLASAVMLDFGQVRTYLFGGSAESEKQVMAPYALHWQAVLDARRAGMRIYDFWGLETASGKAAGFARFKAGFGGKARDYAGAWDWPFSRGAYHVYSAIRKLLGKFR